MKKARICFLASLALLVALGLCAPANVTAAALPQQATPAAPSAQNIAALSRSARSAGQWLLAQEPQPGIGSEQTLFALLQSGTLQPKDAPTQAWLTALGRLSQEELSRQPADRCAWQLLCLQAAEASTQFAHTDVLLAQLAAPNGQALTGENLRMALLVFGDAGYPAPTAFSPQSAAEQWCTTQQPNGSFTAADSTVQATARSLQALAPYIDASPTVRTGADAALAWLTSAQSAYGGYDINASPSAEATAEVLLALSCLPESHFETTAPHPAEALLLFQNEDGSFSPDPNSPPSTALTTQCLLALAAYERTITGEGRIFAFTPLQPGSSSAGSSSASQSPASTAEPLPVWMPFAAGGVVLLAGAWLVGHALHTGRKNPRQKHKKQTAKQRHTALKAAKKKYAAQEKATRRAETTVLDRLDQRFDSADKNCTTHTRANATAFHASQGHTSRHNIDSKL